jgi:enoyl-CoA hydratase/carnithine racemase
MPVMPTVTLVRRGRAAVVTLARPHRRNALDRPTLTELGRLGRELGSDAGVGAVVLTGTGEQAFCAGADLKERAGMTDDEVRGMLGQFRTDLAWLSSSPFPVVAALNGAALGGGLELALACDLRVAVPHAVLGLPETSLGIIPAAGGTQRLPRLVGLAKATELVLLGTRLTAPEALALGIVNRVSVAGASVVDDALFWLAPVLDGSPIAMRAALDTLRASAVLPLADGLQAERRAYEACLVSEDRKEALAAFSEKRTPVFRGR